jgi:hypothetical protein
MKRVLTVLAVAVGTMGLVAAAQTKVGRSR